MSGNPAADVPTVVEPLAVDELAGESAPILLTSCKQDASIQTAEESGPQYALGNDKATQTEPLNISETVVTQRHAELWFDDGDLLLIAGGVEYRVYKELILRHSPKLRDLFHAKQGPQSWLGNGADSVGDQPPGVTILQLPDSPVDLQIFLEAFVSGKTLR